MKVFQIVGEHKKGVKAKIYNKKGPEPRKVSKKPPQQTQAGVATAFAEAATLGDYVAGKSATINDPEHGKTYTLDLTKPENMAALHPNDQGQIEFNPDFDPAGGGLGSETPGQEQQPLQPGAPITIKTATPESGEDEASMSTMPVDEYVKGIYSAAAENGMGAPEAEAVKKQMVLAPNGEVDLLATMQKAAQVFQSPELKQLMADLEALVKQAEEPASEDIGGDPTDDFVSSVVDQDYEKAQRRLRELAGLR